MTIPSFKLSQTLEGHNQDVRALVFIDSKTFASASRDTLVIIWKKLENNNYQQFAVFTKHCHFVNALAFIEPNNGQGQGMLISGGSDKTIFVFDPLNPSIVFHTLLGHTDNVCSLTSTKSGVIVSGSWDSTARVWKDGECIFTLIGHQAAIWGVLALSDTKFVTASADRTLRIWDKSKPIATISGHGDVVRSLIRIPSLGFASCSNDCTIRLWTDDGKSISELHGHNSFVYTLSLLPSGEIISGGEDRTVRLWNGTEQLQSITLPCVSVWSVLGCENGDIIAAGSDGYIRIFSRIVERQAMASDLAAFESLVAATAIPSNQIGDLNKNQVCGIEDLSVPGQKEGEIKMVRNGTAVDAYQWSSASDSWFKIGQVVDAKGSGQKKLYKGKEYDYVFDVDVRDGQPALKLAYNTGGIKELSNPQGNPYDAAQVFIQENQLPDSYLEQIADFIVKNATNVTLGYQEPSTMGDPFTGGDRYIPGSQTPALQKSDLIPHSQYTFFQAAKISAIRGKLLQLNGEMTGSASVLSNEELGSLKTVLDKFEKNAAVFRIEAEEWQVVWKIALSWPEQIRFPGIDLVRLAVMQVETLKITGLADKLARLWKSVSSGPCTLKAQETNMMLAMRVFCNSFKSAEGLKFINNEKRAFVSTLSTLSVSTVNKNLLLSILSFYINLVVSSKNSMDDEFQGVLVDATLQILQNTSDNELCLRCLVIIGTILINNPSLKVYVGSKAGPIVDKVIGKAEQADLKQVALHVQGLSQ